VTRVDIRRCKSIWLPHARPRSGRNVSTSTSFPVLSRHPCGDLRESPLWRRLTPYLYGAPVRRAAPQPCSHRRRRWPSIIGGVKIAIASRNYYDRLSSEATGLGSSSPGCDLLAAPMRSTQAVTQRSAPINSLSLTPRYRSLPRNSCGFTITRALQTVATCRQSPYLHKPAIISQPPFSLSFSLWRHSHCDVIRYWAGHAQRYGRTLRTYGHLTCVCNMDSSHQYYPTYCSYQQRSD